MNETIISDYDFLDAEETISVELPEPTQIETVEEACEVLQLNKEEFTTPSSNFWRTLLEKNPQLRNEIISRKQNEIRLKQDYTCIIRSINGIYRLVFAKDMYLKFSDDICKEVALQTSKSSVGMLARVVKSKWTSAVLSSAIEVALNSVEWYRGEISVKEFVIRTGKSVCINTSLVPISQFGNFVGAGTAALCGVTNPFLLVGAGIIGAIIFAVCGHCALENLCSKFGIFEERKQLVIENLTPEEWLNYCLRLYGVNAEVNLEVLKVKRKDFLLTYHPGRVESEDIKQAHEEKFKMYTVAYEVIVAMRKINPIN